MIKKVAAVDPVMALPGTYLEVKTTPDESNKEYTIALFIGDDAHHSGHLTEKAMSLVNFCSEAYADMSASLANVWGWRRVTRLGLNQKRAN